MGGGNESERCLWDSQVGTLLMVFVFDIFWFAVSVTAVLLELSKIKSSG